MSTCMFVNMLNKSKYIMYTLSRGISNKLFSQNLRSYKIFVCDGTYPTWGDSQSRSRETFLRNTIGEEMMMILMITDG
jgi:hypothetical protein